MNNNTTQGNIKKINIVQEMENSFLDYAMSVIVSRAIPDARDGLKPVHRRILFAMNDLRITPSSQYKKSARIVGDVIGKYHPHGDSSVYDAMVKMAQPFSYRYPLVEGQGNFGSIDGDGAAAMRYTEARLQRISMELLKDIDKDTIDFQENYDATEREPSVLPGMAPNLLLNGATGIAVGMATTIPPHNLNEIADAILKVLHNDDLTIDELLNIVKGPDFPTGGILLGTDGVRDYFETGQGKIVLRGSATIEDDGNNQRIIITEIPYQVNKTTLLEKIAEEARPKSKSDIKPRIEGIRGIRDESTEEIRIVIDIADGFSASAILNRICKFTQFQTSFGVNLLSLVNGEPKTLGVIDLMKTYIAHQEDVIIRRTKFLLNEAELRKEIVEGYVIAISNIDQVVQIIKESSDSDNACKNLINAFEFTERQAKSVIQMRLSRLTSLASDELVAELKSLLEKIADYNETLSSQDKRKLIIEEQVIVLKTKHGDDRRTAITSFGGDIDDEDLIDKENIIISLSNNGYMKRTLSSEYKTQNRGGSGSRTQKLNDGDFLIKTLYALTHDYILYFSNLGKVYRNKGYEVPAFKKNSKGAFATNFLNLSEGEKIINIFAVPGEKVDGYFVFATAQGLIKKVAISEFDRINKNGKKAITLHDEDRLIGTDIISQEDQSIFMATESGIGIKFSAKSVRQVGRSAVGVRGIRTSENVVSMFAVQENSDILVISENGIGKRTPEYDYKVQNRAGKGLKTLNITEKTGKLAKALSVTENESIMVLTEDGMMVITEVSQISTSGRNTQGVKIINLKENQKIVSLEKFSEEAENLDNE